MAFGGQFTRQTWSPALEAVQDFAGILNAHYTLNKLQLQLLSTEG